MFDVNIKKDHMKTIEAYRAGLMIKPQLRNLFLELTVRCNERCLHCGSSCGDVSSDELTLQQYSKFLAEIKGDFGTKDKMLCITGGEPLLRKDFFDIMAVAHDLGFNWGMTSNATLIDKQAAKDLKRVGMNTISVSIDGLEETHDAFRRTPGGYKTAMEGIVNLLEMVLLTAEMMELRANPKRRARGLVIEAELDKGKGPVATVLVQKGTLRVGDAITAGCAHGKVRAMIDDKGRRVKEAGPSTPVEILGFSDVPAAGDIVIAPETEKEARTMAEAFIARGREKMLEDTKLTMSLDDLYSQIQSGNLKELKLIIKADVQGSVEAVKQSLMKLSNDEVAVRCIHGGVGAINESDVMLANASGAIIIGFNVRPDVTAKANAERDKVEIKLYRVIYDAIADVEKAMKGMLDPIFEEKVIGHAEIRQIFKASGVGNIAGSYVLDGMFQRGCTVRIKREGKQIFEGPLASLKRFKDDVKEVKAGYECGLVFEKFGDIQELDIVEAYIMVEVPR